MAVFISLVPGHIHSAAGIELMLWTDIGGHGAPGLEADWPAGNRRTSHDFFIPGQWVITQRGDTCRPGAFVWCKTPRQGVARITGLYTLAHISGAETCAPKAIVVVDLFDITDRHEVYDCPRLVKRGQYILSPHVSLVPHDRQSQSKDAYRIL